MMTCCEATMQDVMREPRPSEETLWSDDALLRLRHARARHQCIHIWTEEEIQRLRTAVLLLDQERRT